MLSLLRAKPPASTSGKPTRGVTSPAAAGRQGPSNSRSTACGAVKAEDAVHPDYVLTVSIIRSLRNDYAFLLHERISRETAVIDPHDAGPIISLARAQGWKIQHVLNTHHHNCAGNLALKRLTGCKIHGPAAEADRIPGIDVGYKGGETFSLGKLTAEVMHTPGHTVGHLSFWFSGAGVLFCGDVLTPLGCGRFVEGTPHDMWRSLDRIRNLPPETLIYSGFECAQPNSRFALSLDRQNMWLRSRLKRIDESAKIGRATVPSKLEDEHATNLFLRADDPRVAEMLGLNDAGPIETLTELRKRRDSFQLQSN